MSNWPQICNYCGAPLQGARCPRCNYERQPFGKVVLSGVAGGGFPEVVFLESIVSGATTPEVLTSAPVTLVAGDVLFVGIAWTNAVGLGVGQNEVVTKWGATVLTEPASSGGLLNPDFSSAAWCNLYTATAAGTETVTVDFSAQTVPDHRIVLVCRIRGISTGPPLNYDDRESIESPSYPLVPNLVPGLSIPPAPALFLFFWAQTAGSLGDTKAVPDSEYLVAAQAGGPTLTCYLFASRAAKGGETAITIVAGPLNQWAFVGYGAFTITV